jgi:Xaa-Pro aminopeptidase
MDFLTRQRRLQAALAGHRLDALLVTHLPNLQYLCGFTGSAGALWVTPDSCVFFSDSRYTEQASEEVQGARVVIQRKALLPSIAGWVVRKQRGAKRPVIGLEGEHISWAASQRFAKALAGKYKLRSVSSLVEQARLIKDKDEIEAIRRSVELGASLFDDALPHLRPGVSEVEVASILESAARRAGAEGISFETIVASGARSALPHGRATKARIASGGFVVCDFGVILHGYCSDRTRTVWVGPATTEARQVYKAVLEAQAAAMAEVGPGVSVGAVDRAARNVLKKQGLDKYFTHSTGHGVGLEVHEAPRVAAGLNDRLEPGMVITIEPGVYLTGQWGVRIEDMVLVTEKGCEVLSPGIKDFIAI